MSKHMKGLARALAAGVTMLIALALPATGALAATHTVDQTGTNVAGWVVGDDPSNATNPTHAFRLGPGTPPLGAGSLEVSVTAGGYSKFLLSRTDYAGARISDFTTLSYSTYYNSTNTGTKTTWYLNLYLDTSGDGVSDARVDFAPKVTALDTWTTWDLRSASNAFWSYPTGPTTRSSGHTWAEILARYPGAKIASSAFAAAPGSPAVVFNMGDSAGNYRNITTSLDNITFGLDGADETWDLEPPLPNLTVTKTDDVSGAVALGNAWDWTLKIANTGDADAIFTTGQKILIDDLPSTGLDYGGFSVDTTGGASGMVACAVDGSFRLTCTVTTPVVALSPGSTYSVSLQATSTASGVYSNPRDSGACSVDPDGVVTESIETDNPCVPDTVTVTAPTCGLVANCSFEDPAGAGQLPDVWHAGGVTLATDGTDTAVRNTGLQSFRFTNARARAKSLTQDIAVTAPAGTDFALNFAWRGQDVAGRAGLFRVTVTLFYKSGSKKFYTNMPIGTNDWTTYPMTFTAAKAVTKARIEIDFGKKGTAWFDDFNLTTTTP